ncbi:MAG: uncharacterized protein PWQ57_2235 [Desulfovibrionales bacterium]|jgi:uncharacterized protein YlxP (DUF503 family)|nr:uncharacterized protein [Desulfovibrionales bacterium]
MIIGLLRVEFRLHGNDSLKGKRKVCSSLKQKVANKFNVAVAEVEAMDNKERLVLGIVTVANQTSKVDSRLSKVQAMIEAISPAEVVHVSTEVFSDTEEAAPW